MKRETVTMYDVAGERLEKKADAEARAGELTAEAEESYRAAVAALEGQAARAAEILGRDVADVHLALPAPPPAAEVEKVELVRAFEVHSLERTDDGEGRRPERVVARPLTLDRKAAAGEVDRLKGETEGWRGPRPTYELVERLLPADVADRLAAEEGSR